MKLNEVIRRNMSPRPWEEGEKIPWNDLDFSRRMLKEHLTQRHDAASRRFSVIDQHVKWIHETILKKKRSKILDLGCGPGLYSSRLALLGHKCHGIDFSPASIDFAKDHAPSSCTYVLSDVRKAEFGQGYDLAMFIYGELNVFRPSDAGKIFRKANSALKPGGKLLLEISTFEAIEQLGNQPSTWYSSKGGLFSDRPHFCLMESFWDSVKSVATERYHIVDSATGDVVSYASSSQAYTNRAIKLKLHRAGFNKIEMARSLTGGDISTSDDLIVIIASK